MCNYSMNELVSEICAKHIYRYRNGKDNNYYNATNRSKNIKKVLKNIGLYDFIEYYKGGKNKVFNHEWYDVFLILMKLIELDGTTQQTNPGRKRALHEKIAIKNSFTIRNAELFDAVVKAIKKGDQPDLYLKKLKETDFYNKSLISSYELVILYNYKTLFDDLDSNYENLSKANIVEMLHKIKENSNIIFDDLINSYETLNGYQVKEIMKQYLSNYEKLIHELELPFAPLLTTVTEII